MSTAKTKPTHNNNDTTAAQPEPASYRINPEVEAKIDAFIQDSPKYWNYLQTMPRERLERTVVLSEIRTIERQERIRDSVMQRINADPRLKQAYETLVKDVPEEQREEVMTQMQRQKQRVVARSNAQQHTHAHGVTA